MSESRLLSSNLGWTLVCHAFIDGIDWMAIHIIVVSPVGMPGIVSQNVRNASKESWDLV
jgi:hypothetical protein